MRIFTGLLFLVATSVASAQIVFAPSISYTTQEIDNGSGGVSKEKIMFGDLRLAYLHSSGLFLGGTYSMAKLGDETNSTDGFSVGPTIGFSHYSGFYALFTYFLMSEQEVVNSGVIDTRTDGMGPQIDVGWAFPLTAMFHLGPQITYRSVAYDKLDSAGGGASTDVDVTLSYMMPSIMLWFNF